MKKVYEKPVLEMERYELSSSVASNCAKVVHNGPEVGDHHQCEDYEDPFAMSVMALDAEGGPYNVQFYEDTNCDCYYSSSDYGYWTS